MAIDPSIVFQQRQVPSPMDSAVKAQNLKNILLQNQSNRQLVEQNNLKLQQMKQEMEDEQTAKSIISKYGGDISQAQPELVQAMGGRALPVLENIAKTQKAIDGMDDARRKQAQDSLSTISNMIDGVASLPPEQRQQAYQIKLSQLVQSGALPIERARTMPRQWDESVALLGDRMKQLSAEMDARSKRTTAEKAETELRGAKADTAEKEMKQRAREDFFAKNPNATLFDYIKEEARAKHIPVAGRDVPLPKDVEAQQARIAKEKIKADGAASGIEFPDETTEDPTSKSILAQTGLSLPAFYVLTGKASQLPRDRVSRQKAMFEAQKWANGHGADVSTMAAQYKSYNDVLTRNIERMNSTRIMEDELTGTVENLQGVVKEKDLGNLRWTNLARIWAGQEVNDNLAQQYAMHLSQLRNELMAYFGATQGRSGNNLTLEDRKEAESVIRNGIASGSLSGMLTAVKNSTGKMDNVMQRSVDSARKQVWNLFGVGKNYGTVNKPKSDPLGIF